MLMPMLAEMSGNLHVGLAALGAALGVGFIGMKASEAVGRNPGAATQDSGAVHLGHRVRRSHRVLRPLPREVTGRRRGAEPAPRLALTDKVYESVHFICQASAATWPKPPKARREKFGLDVPHFIAQVISFLIVAGAASPSSPTSPF